MPGPRPKGEHRRARNPAYVRRAGAAGAHSPSVRRAGRATADPPVSAVRWRALVIVLAGLLTYSSALSSPFLFDDRNSIVDNPQIRTLWPLSVPLSPLRDTPVAGRPLVNLTFALNYAVGGLDVRGYHIVNLAIHLLAALALFGVVRRTLSMPRLEARFGRAAPNVAWAVALVWTLHPLQTETVNYLSERTESLMGLFYLLTLYFSIRAYERAGPRWAAAAVASCAAGMACKESMVTAPLMVMLYDRVFVFDSIRMAVRARSSLYSALCACWVVLAALLWSTPRTSAGFASAATSWVYLLNQFELIVRYLWLTVWPRALVLDYGLPKPLALTDVWPQALLVTILTAVVLVGLARRPPLGFLGTWVLLTLAPTTSVIPIVTEVGAERRMYLPLAAVVTLAVVTWFVATRGRRSWSIGAGAIICVLLAAGTVLRNREYDSRLSMAQTIVERRPSGRGHYVLAIELLRAGRRPEALAELRASARDYPDAHYALGTELFADGMLDAAVTELRTFVETLPTHPNVVPARDQLGRAFLTQGRVDDALREFNFVLTQPGYRNRAEVVQIVDEIQAERDAHR